MELKQVTSTSVTYAVTGLNRTFMELKLDEIKSAGGSVLVLIEPLWN